MSGSSWYFKRFVYLAVKILDGEVEISIQQMADFINFEDEADFINPEDAKQNGQKDDDEVSYISENYFIDNEEVQTDVNFCRHFANVENDIEQVLKDAHNEPLQDIDRLD